MLCVCVLCVVVSHHLSLNARTHARGQQINLLPRMTMKKLQMLLTDEQMSYPHAARAYSNSITLGTHTRVHMYVHVVAADDVKSEHNLFHARHRRVHALVALFQNNIDCLVVALEIPLVVICGVRRAEQALPLLIYC